MGSLAQQFTCGSEQRAGLHCIRTAHQGVTLCLRYHNLHGASLAILDLPSSTSPVALSETAAILPIAARPQPLPVRALHGQTRNGGARRDADFAKTIPPGPGPRKGEGSCMGRKYGVSFGGGGVAWVMFDAIARNERTLCVATHRGPRDGGQCKRVSVRAPDLAGSCRSLQAGFCKA